MNARLTYQLVMAMVAIVATDIIILFSLRWLFGPKSSYGLMALPINLYVGWIIGRTSGKWFNK